MAFEGAQGERKGPKTRHIGRKVFDTPGTSQYITPAEMQDDKAFEPMAEARHSGVVVDLVGEVLQRKGRVCLTISSGSMAPRLEVGDRAEVERFDGDGPKLGELVLLRDPVLGHVIHRLLWRRPLQGGLRLAYTKGDAARYRDRRVTADRVLGKVVRVVRDGSLVVESPLERSWCWMRSVAGMVVQGVLGRWSSRGAAAPESCGAGDGELATPDEMALRRDAPRRRL